MIPSLLSAELRKFCETTSVRGVSRIIKSQSRGLFIIWLLGVLTCAGLLIWQLVVVFQKYTSYPVNSLLVRAPAWQYATFPDITVCNLCSLVHESNMSVRYTDFLSNVQGFIINNASEFYENYTKSLDPSVIKYLENYWFSPTAYFNNFPISDVYTTPDTNPPVLDYSYFNWDYSLNNNYNDDYSLNVKRIWDPDYYVCHMFSLAESERNNVRGFSTVLYVDDFLDSLWMDYSLDLSNSRSTGMRVMIHPPGTVPNMKLGMSIAPGMETTITLSQTSYIHLPAPYSNCTTQARIGPLIDNATYTVDYCYDACVQKQFLKECGCIFGLLQFTSDQLDEANNTICGNLGITDTNSSINWDGFSKFVCATLLPVDKSVCLAECLTPCEEIEYSTSVTEAPWPHVSAQATFWYTYIRDKSRFDNMCQEYQEVADLSLANKSVAQAILKKLNSEGSIRNNFLQLNIRFNSPNYMDQKDVEAVSLNAFGAQIGGVLSLWLGVTAILVFELCEFIFNVLVICCCRKKKLSTGTHETCDNKL